MAQSAGKSTRTKKAGNKRGQGTKAKTKPGKGQARRQQPGTPDVAKQGQRSLGVKSLLSFEDYETLRQISAQSIFQSDQAKQSRRPQRNKTDTSGKRPSPKRPRHPSRTPDSGQDSQKEIDAQKEPEADVIELKEHNGEWICEAFEIPSPTVDALHPPQVATMPIDLPPPPPKKKTKGRVDDDIKASPTSNDPLGRYAAGCVGLLVLIGILVVGAIDIGQKLEIKHRSGQTARASLPIMRAVSELDSLRTKKPKPTSITATKKLPEEPARTEETVISIHRAAPEATPVPRTNPVTPIKPVFVSSTATPPPSPTSTPLPFIVASPCPDRLIYMPESVKRLARGRGWKPVVVTVQVLADGSPLVIDVNESGSIPSFVLSRLKEAVVSASWVAARDNQGSGVDAVTRVVFRFDGRRK